MEPEDAFHEKSCNLVGEIGRICYNSSIYPCIKEYQPIFIFNDENKDWYLYPLLILSCVQYLPASLSFPPGRETQPGIGAYGKPPLNLIVGLTGIPLLNRLVFRFDLRITDHDVAPRTSDSRTSKKAFCHAEDFR